MSIDTIGIIGAGTMGAGIAQVAAATGFKVALIDVDKNALSKALERISSGFDRVVKKGQMSAEAKQAALNLIRTATDYEILAAADLIVEAATENAEVKEKIVQAVDKTVRAEAIISTTTSSVSITKLAGFVTDPGRFIGMHFFNPVPVMKLVEVVRGLQTTDTTHHAAIEVAKKMGKTRITVKNTPGFVVNRLLLPMINEAFFALSEGDASAEEIDEGMKLGCNHPMGPLALADLIGLDV
ncbi:MAG: 3-hydroxybutyryl-CoA dehydrogenase, partial [Acetobacteraceae bacterium]|nr:3-hydroxybutyryl-CoA dehydrogenase [Acetobacteraceae bacterium]